MGDDVSVNAETNKKSTNIIAKIADNDQNKMNAMFEDIQQSDGFEQNVHQTSTNLISQQFSSFEIDQIDATIKWIKPTTTTETPASSNTGVGVEIEEKEDLSVFIIGGLILLFSVLMCCFGAFIIYKIVKKSNKNKKMVELGVQEERGRAYVNKVDIEHEELNKQSVETWLSDINMSMYLN